jgi:hypothetical protein
MATIAAGMALVYLSNGSHRNTDIIASFVVGVGALLTLLTMVATKIYTIEAKKYKPRLGYKSRKIASMDYTSQLEKSANQKKENYEHLSEDEQFQLFTEKIAYFTHLRILLEVTDEDSENKDSENIVSQADPMNV